MQAILQLIKGIDEAKIVFGINPIIKRGLDILISIGLLIFFSPVLTLIMGIIFVQTKANPIYIQKRGLTIDKYSFNIFKLRTLYPNIKNDNKEIHNVLIQSNFAKSVIPIGGFLRRTGIDEIPQLINVLMGKMSLIGPRPLSLHDLEIIKKETNELYKRRENLNVKPGISGYWQIFGDREKGIQNLIEYDEYYANNKSFLLDMFLMMMTLPLMLFARHTDAIVRDK